MTGARAFFALLWRDVRLAWRTGGAGLALAFFILTIVLLPFASSLQVHLLPVYGPGLVWILALLAVLLTLERLFQADLEAGVLDLMAGAAVPLETVAIAKVAAHWLGVGLPLTVMAPVAGLLLGLSGSATWILVLSFLIGLPGLSAVGGIAAALSGGVRRGSLLITLLVLPFYAPFVIFGAGAAMLAANPAPPLTPLPSLLYLGAASLIAFIVVIVLGASAVRSQIE
jgi:heme exporter protein B